MWLLRRHPLNVFDAQQYIYTRQLEWAKWAAIDECKRAQEVERAERAASRMGAITPPSDADELAIVAPSTPKASARLVKQLLPAPVTPPGQIGTGIATGPAPGAPLDITQDGPPPGQPRKTPRTKRIATQMDIDEQDENLDVHANGMATEEEEDTETEDKKMEAEEAKDELCALKQPPASPVKGGPASRGRVAAPKPVRSAPATERTVRTTRATTRSANTGPSTRHAAVAPAPLPASATLRARGAAAVAKAKAASATGAGAATTTNAGSTSYKVNNYSEVSGAAT